MLALAQKNRIPMQYAKGCIKQLATPQNIKNAKEYVDEALSIAMHAMRVGVHFTMGSSPGNFAFNRDMFLNIPLIADWHAVTLKREHLINENLMRENQKRRRYDYIPQQKVLKKT